MTVIEQLVENRIEEMIGESLKAIEELRELERKLMEEIKK